MSRDSCPAQGHVEGHTHLCRTPCLLQTLTMLPPVGETPALSAPVSKAHSCLMKSVFCNNSQPVFPKRLYQRPEEWRAHLHLARSLKSLCFFVKGDDDEEWTSDAEGEAPPAAVSDPDGGGGASGDSSNVTSPPPGQEGGSPHPPAPRLRLKAGLATDPALRITDATTVLTSALPPTATGLEYLAALNPAFHSGETKVKCNSTSSHFGGKCLK